MTKKLKNVPIIQCCRHTLWSSLLSISWTFHFDVFVYSCLNRHIQSKRCPGYRKPHFFSFQSASIFLSGTRAVLLRQSFKIFLTLYFSDLSVKQYNPLNSESKRLNLVILSVNAVNSVNSYFPSLPFLQ